VSDIANMLSLNRSHMTRLFKKATGTTIQEYLISYRMKVAMKMMEDPICPINHISFAVGYNDVFTFSKAFKQHVGVSPSDYRKTLESDTSSQEDS
jgi:AraC family transcriptional regulator of arabinose operon